MKNTIAKLFIVLTLVAALTVLTFAQNPNDFLITKNSVGKVKIGMTVGEAKKIWRDYKFERTSDAEVSTMIAVKKGNEILMRIYTGERDNSNENLPIQNSERIEYIEIWSKKFKTSEGVHPAMLLQTAEDVYGKVENIIRSEMEMREYAEFAKQPEGIDFRLSSKADFAGVDYKKDEKGLEVTKQFVPSAYILYIAIAEVPAKQIEIPEGQKEFSIEDVLRSGDEKIKFVIQGKERHRLTVTIKTISYSGEEGPVMYGVITAPNGESDGQPGGKIFDWTVTDGDYEIMVAQNMAKSGARNVRFKLIVRMEPIYE